MLKKASLLTLLSFFGFTKAQAAGRVLLSAFEPFGGRTENSSQLAVETLVQDLRANPDPTLPPEIEHVILPVAYDIAPQELLRKMDSYRPDIVISLGESGDAEIHLEKRARNKDDSPFADNRGVARMGETIVKGGPDYLATRLPVDAFLKDLTHAGIKAALSNSAGSYLCNHVFYHLMYTVTTEPNFKSVPAGFVHVPAQSLEHAPEYPKQYAEALRLMIRRLNASL